MKKIPILAIIPMLLLALTPPLSVQLDCTINSTFWLWMTFVSGFLAFFFLYQKVSVWLKLLVVWCFVSCFLSSAPYLSLTMFWSVITCAYYFALCKKITDWKLVLKVIQSIFFFMVLLVIMQLFGKDTLLNFGLKIPKITGTIGNKMIASSFMCVLAPFLIFNPLNWIALAIMSFITTSSSAIFSIGTGFAVYAWGKFKKARTIIVILAILTPIVFAWKTGDFSEVAFKAGRFPVYKDTLQLSLKRPLGFGIGSYKILYPIMCSKEIADEQPGSQWSTCHNDWLQILWETGFIGFFLFLGWIITIVINVVKQKNYIKLAGLVIIGSNMMFAFPQRMVQSAFILLIFLAYCSQDNENSYELSDDGESSYALPD